MNEIEKKRLINFFFKLNYGKLSQIEIIKGGKNSKVYKIISKKKNIIIKQYYGYPVIQGNTIIHDFQHVPGIVYSYRTGTLYY